MKHAAWIAMVREGTVRNVDCTICGDLRKACYRRRFKGYPDFVFVVIPCHGCSMRLFREHPLYRANLELADSWRNQNDLAEKLIADEIKRAALPPVEMPPPSFARSVFDRMARLEPQNTLQPSQPDPAEEIDEEA